MHKRFAWANLASFFGFILLLYSGSLLSNQESTVNSVNATASVPNYQLVGEADVHWLWVKLYTARLYTPSGLYNNTSTNLSLELTYARDFKREELIKGTLKEWQRQKLYFLPKWTEDLEKIWPNINANDRLLLAVDKNHHSDFFYNDEYIGSIKDKAFATAFTAIWLSENTQKPELRQQLIGYGS
jgi:hypothetical protein